LNDNQNGLSIFAANSFAPRKVVLLDAVSTVIHTYPGVVEVYQRQGQKFGSALENAEIKRRFKAARRKLFAVDTSAKDQIEGDLISSDTIERTLWQNFIEFVFYDVADSAGLFAALWDFFADPNNWRIYADVADCLALLKQQGHYVAIASNFDSRLIPIVDSFPELSTLDETFCSAMVGFRKPDPAFYRAVQRRIDRALGTKVASIDVVFAGDCIENDFHGPRCLGWTAFWLDRNGEPGDVVGCPEGCRISSLKELSIALG